MEKNEAEEVVKNTIEYANEEIKKSKKKYLRMFVCCLAVALFCIVITITMYFIELDKNKISGGYELTCFLNGETNTLSVVYNKKHNISASSGDIPIYSNIKILSYNNADELVSDIIKYYEDNGGTCDKRVLDESEYNEITVQAISKDELNELKNDIIKKVSEKSDYKNFTNCYLEEKNFSCKIIVELKNNSIEEQKWFKENISNSKYIKFIQSVE